MTEPYRPRKYVIGPDGSPLTIADLPAPGTTRWVIRRKAEVVAAVRGGLLSLEEACSRYMLTVRLIATASPGCGRPASSNIAQ
jgi:hypothetical protein